MLLDALTSLGGDAVIAPPAARLAARDFDFFATPAAGEICVGGSSRRRLRFGNIQDGCCRDGEL